MKRLLLLAVSIMSFASANGQQVLNLLTGEVREGSDAANPVRTVETLEDGYLVTWEFTEAELMQDAIYPDCVFFQIPEFQNIDELGMPAFQYNNDIFLVEKSATSVEIVESHYIDCRYKLSPARPELPVSDNFLCWTTENAPVITPYEGFQPLSIIKDAGYSLIQKKRYVNYLIYPFQYSYEQQIIRAYTKIVFRVNLSTSSIEDFPLINKGSVSCGYLSNGVFSNNTPLNKLIVIENHKYLVK